MRQVAERVLADAVHRLEDPEKSAGQKPIGSGEPPGGRDRRLTEEGQGIEPAAHVRLGEGFARMSCGKHYEYG